MNNKSFLDTLEERASQFRRMIDEYEKDCNSLEQERVDEERYARIYDPHHPGYPKRAKSADRKRDNFKSALKDLKLLLARAEEELASFISLPLFIAA